VDSRVILPGQDFDSEGLSERSFISHSQHDYGLTGFINYRRASPRLKRAILAGIEKNNMKDVFVLAEKYNSFLILPRALRERIGYLIRLVPEKMFKREVKDDLILAIIYIASEEYNFLLTINDFKKYLIRDHKYFFGLIKKLRNELNIKRHILRPEDFINLVCSKINLEQIYVNKVFEILKRVDIRGGNPIIIAAVAVFIVVEREKGEDISTDLCEIVDTTNVSLKRKIEIMKALGA